VVEGYYQTVVRELSRLGFQRVSGGKGSHEKWIGGSDTVTLIVPRNLRSRHTANAILRDAGSAVKV
jgi:predicted RNA binding protein YcfA (HicA-like mRNA interferase family)